MKNITLSVDEKTLKAARVFAAEHDTTVSALVRGYLESLASGLSHEQAVEAMRAAARQELVELSRKSKAEVGPISWKREDLYER